MPPVYEIIDGLMATPGGTLKLSGGIGVAGILLLLTGLGLGKLLRSDEKYNQRHLERAQEASFAEGMSMFFRNPAVTFPVSLMFVGGMLLVGSVVGAIAGAIRYLSS